MQADKIEDVMSEFLGEGYRIVGDDGDEDEKVEVTFQDGSTRTFDKGVPMRQIWHEYAD